MPGWRRWVREVWGSVDRAVAQLEDHEAVVERGLQQLIRNHHEAADQLERLRAEGANLGARISARVQERDALRSEAVACTDEARAIELLRRARRSERHKQVLQERLQTLAERRSKLEARAAELADRIASLHGERQRMRARVERADASAELASADQVEALIERWARSVQHAHAPEDEVGLELDDERFDALLQRHEDEELRAELSELRRSAEQ
ncbi:MAG: hypothetical protein OXT09_00410 [Myxococcales bacterium]|nr:hypothetical protein [Myxococcales bacterium]